MAVGGKLTSMVRRQEQVLNGREKAERLAVANRGRLATAILYSVGQFW